MNTVCIRIGALEFSARFEDERAPLTSAAFLKVLPFESKLVQARWSGEAAWIPLGDLDLQVPHENATSHPAPGEILFHPPGLSECEILFPYGGPIFRSKVGQLAGNHFLTVTGSRDQLMEVGRMVLWQGAQDISFRLQS
jgi:hypothetical protein